MPDTSVSGKRLVMAFDFGSKRHGVATGNELTGTATPLQVITAKEGVPVWAQLDVLVQQWQPDIFLVGLPLEEDLGWNDLSLRARKLAKRLFGRYGKTCYGMDERGSTRAAKAIVRQQGHRGNYREDPVDSLAAAIILESWLALSHTAADNQAAMRFLQPLAGPEARKQPY